MLRTSTLDDTDINIISSSVFEGTSSILPTSDTTTSFAVGKL
jgi:hypothetical protein